LERLVQRLPLTEPSNHLLKARDEAAHVHIGGSGEELIEERQQVITAQVGGTLIPLHMDRAAYTSLVCVVHAVIVDERKVVEHRHAQRSREGPLPVDPEDLPGYEK